MIPEEKIQGIKKQLRNGVPAGEIKATLAREGYPPEDIDKCFPARKSDMRNWYLIFAIIFLAAGLLIFYKYGSFLLLIFSAVMLYQYYLADKKMKKIE